jgi:hypothetical protein
MKTLAVPLKTMLERPADGTLTQPTLQVTDNAWKEIQGGYDLHVHVAPDVIARGIAGSASFACRSASEERAWPKAMIRRNR